MGMSKAVVVFMNDKEIQKNEQLVQLVNNSLADFSVQLVDNQVQVLVKEVQQRKKTKDKIRMLAGEIARELRNRKVKNAEIHEESLWNEFSSWPKDDVVTAFVEGWELGSYQFIKYKHNVEAFTTELSWEGTEFSSAIEAGKTRAKATMFARDLKNEIPSFLNPVTFPEILEDIFKDTAVNVTVLRQPEIEQREMNGILTVCRGSKHDPAFVELSYCGDETKPLVALVGKGVTFDTGGISLKNARDLSNMRMDMGGAAAVSGAMKLLADSGAKVNVVALIPIVENIPDNISVLPGDVITYKNGLHVQVANTDYEGRLILADGIIRATELEAEYIFNISTLTGSIMMALGTEMAGAFGNEELTFAINKIGEENGDFIWPMPLIDTYKEHFSSNYADFSNLPKSDMAGAIAGGLFLSNFIPEDHKWLHIDMAGVMESTERGYYGNSATGFGVRLLADFTEHVSE